MSQIPIIPLIPMLVGQKDAKVFSGDGWVVVEDQGSRDHMEDRHVASTFTWNDGRRRLDIFGVFDGHNGDAVSHHCRKHLAERVAAVLRTSATVPESVPRCLQRAFHEVDEHAAATPGVDAHAIGSTACVVIITQRHLWVANSGDSRAFLHTSDGAVVALSDDHKPTKTGERERILRAGGTISYADGSARVQGRLNLSRSLGDRSLRPYVICTPDVVHRPRPDPPAPHRGGGGGRGGGSEVGAGYVIIASDGIWDVLTNEQVAAIVDGRRKSITQGLLDVLTQARMRGSGDNVTIMYVSV